MTTITTMLKERDSTHGNFTDNSRVSQNLKAAMKDSPNWAKLRPEQKEALEMDAHKIARILCGDADYHDHWFDIEGYTRLVSKSLEIVIPETVKKGRK